ncbi:MAG: hypothetical protein U9P61_01940 [Patescibacteria group bacterium]|nr:hypothetical protein [Patescibacteria group bacterium]
MKSLFRVVVILAIVFFTTSCCGINVESNIGSSPLFHYGERVWVVNGLKHNIEVIYKTWGMKHVKSRLSPGQESMITGLCNGDYLLVRVYNHTGEVIGATTKRVRGRRRTQIWQVKRYYRLR